MTTPDTDDPRVAARIRLIFQIAGSQDSSRPNRELADRLRHENERVFLVISPRDREALQIAVRRATNT